MSVSHQKLLAMLQWRQSLCCVSVTSTVFKKSWNNDFVCVFTDFVSLDVHKACVT